MRRYGWKEQCKAGKKRTRWRRKETYRLEKERVRYRK